MSVGQVIRQLRKEKNMSQADLAYATGLSKGAISMYELDERRPKIETLEVLADYFNVDMNFLTGRSSTTTIISPAPAPSLSPDQKDLLDKYDVLNDEGKAEAVRYIGMLSAVSAYIEEVIDIERDA